MDNLLASRASIARRQKTGPVLASEEPSQGRLRRLSAWEKVTAHGAPDRLWTNLPKAFACSQSPTPEVSKEEQPQEPQQEEAQQQEALQQGTPVSAR